VTSRRFRKEYRSTIRDLGAGGTIDHAIFYCRLPDRSLLDTIEFYSEDLRTLRQLARSVSICTSLRELRRAEDGLLWAWWHASAAPAVLYWRSRGLPSVVTGAVDLSNPLETRRRHQIKRALTYLVARTACVNVAISDYEAADLRRLAHDACVITLQPGVDCNYFAPQTLSDFPSLVTIAQMNGPSIHRKGIDRALQVFELVRQRVPGAQLTIVGPVRTDGEAWLEQQGVSSRFGVTVAGQVSREEKKSILGSAWVYVQLSRYEGFGLAVAEAMASGATPIVTRVGSLPEVVGQPSLVFDYEPATIAEAICHHIRRRPDSQERLSVRQQSMKFASETRLCRLREALTLVAGPSPDRSTP
jgi:glycosyltransferase involved in cell wall biosynthesis